MQYLSLHNHTDRSNNRFRDSTNKLGDLISYTHQLGLSGIAITDHENIGASLKAQQFLNAQRKKDSSWDNYKIVNGNEIYLCPDWVDKEHVTTVFPHFILNALDAEGYKQIRVLSTIAWKRSFIYKGLMRVPTHYQDLRDIIEPNQGHVLASSACLGGALPRHLLEYRDSGNIDIFDQCKMWVQMQLGIFGGENFFLELQPSDNPDQVYVNRKLIELSKILSVPYIITTDAHYLKKEDRAVHRAFIQSQQADREVDEFYRFTYCMDEAEIHEIMDGSLGEKTVQQGLDNTLMIYNRAQEYDLEKPLRIPYMCLDHTEPSKDLFEKYKDKIPLLEKFYYSSFDGDRHLVREICKGIESKEDMQNQKAYDDINMNLEYIKASDEKMGVHWSAYLLTEQNNVNTIWDKAGSLVGVARGSGSGFILLYVLGITQVNPEREDIKTFAWRFLNPYRTSVLDIDIDIEANARENCINAFKEVYGEDSVSQVLTLTTEGSRSAILTACRGLNVNNDYAQYLASLIQSDRGITRTLEQMYYGDEENGFKAEPIFKAEMDSHPDIWNTALKIQGLICGCGAHAGGVIVNDLPFYESTSLMKTNSGIVVTSYELHECESVSLIKFDLLSIDALDKIKACLQLLLKDGRIQWQGSLKNTYEKYLGVYALERKDHKMWEMLWNHSIISFFQMEKDSGKKAIALIRPTSVSDLAVINSTMRLMASEKGAEQPLDKLARFKKDISLWYREMDEYGLTKKEESLLEPILNSSYGLCIFQEQMMQLVQLPEAGGFDLLWADKLRKSVAKKQPKNFKLCEKEYFERVEERHLSKNFANYIWNVLISTQRGYGFNASHTCSYSLIGLQEANLASRWPIIYWDCANLLVDSGSVENSEDKAIKYGKISIAIGHMQKEDVNVTPPLINESNREFRPDVQHNRIVFGLKAIKNVNDDLAKIIISNRPYASLEDFLTRIYDAHLITDSQMVCLIKAQCFSSTPEKDMEVFLQRLYKPVSKLGLAQINKVIESGVIDERSGHYTEYRMINFKKYVLDDSRCVELVKGAKVPKCGYNDRLFVLDNASQPFFKQYFSEDSIVKTMGEHYVISEKKFTKEIKARYIDQLVLYLNEKDIINKYNKYLWNVLWEKYAEGTPEHWAMEVLSYYPNAHELDCVDLAPYGVVDFYSEPETAEVYDYYYKWLKDNGTSVQKPFPKYKIQRISGTVIDFNATHYTVTLQTPTGVVDCKLSKGEYIFYSRTLSEIIDGKKKVIEQGWFKRGTVLLVAGYRRDDVWVAKTYVDSVYKHTVNRVINIKDGKLIVQQERADVE